MKIKIAIVLHNMDYGGLQTVSLNLGKYLQNNGYNVDVVTTFRRGNLFDKIAASGMRAMHISGKYNTHHLVHAYKAGQETLKNSYNVIIACNYERYIQASINMLPLQTIVIPWLHNHDNEVYLRAAINKDAWNVAVGVGPKVTEAAREKCTNRPVVYIPNGIEPPPEKQFNLRLKHTKPFQLIYVGRIHEAQKGIMFLPEIVKSCLNAGMDTSLTIIGDGPDSDKLKKKIKELNLEQKCHLKGRCEKKEVYQNLLLSHVLLMPSFYEGLPCVPIEAQMCGCVPVLSHLHGITDAVVQNDKTGFLIDVGHIQGFVQAILKLYKMPQLWENMSLAGRKMTLKNFTPERMGEMFMNLIEETLKGKYPPLQRNKLLPVNPLAFTWKELIPRKFHKLGLGNYLRKFIGH